MCFPFFCFFSNLKNIRISYRGGHNFNHTYIQCGPPSYVCWFRFAPVTSSLFAYHVYHSEIGVISAPKERDFVNGGLTYIPSVSWEFWPILIVFTPTKTRWPSWFQKFAMIQSAIKVRCKKMWMRSWGYHVDVAGISSIFFGISMKYWWGYKGISKWDGKGQEMYLYSVFMYIYIYVYLQWDLYNNQQ